MKKLYNKKMKSVKMIFLMVGIGMMLITSCSTENAELNTNEKTNSKQLLSKGTVELPDLGEGSWYTLISINEVNYIEINGIKANEIINIATGTCESCRAKCTYDRQINENAHLVNCDNGHSYFAVNCNDGTGWHVYSADTTYTHHYGSSGGVFYTSNLAIAPPC